MTSKADERKALESIKTILAGIDSNGYVNPAFKGCVADAESNIDNDFMNCKAEKVETLEKKLATITKNADDTTAAYNELKKQHAITIKARDEYNDAYLKTWNELVTAKDKIDDLENEIIRLKAKLYDLMVK